MQRAGMTFETGDTLHGLWMSLAVLAASLEEMRRGVESLSIPATKDWLAAYA